MSEASAPLAPTLRQSSLAQVILISGLSGSGKSVALRALEDSGYFCVDNLPLSFVEPLVSNLIERHEPRIALTLDARGKESFHLLPSTVQRLRQEFRLDVRVLYLEATDTDLQRRFSETRRPHPLAEGRFSMADSIARERSLLMAAADLGRRLDTSAVSPNTLRGWIRDFVALDPTRLTLFLESFGFKNGIPLNADFVFDVRCLPNPFYDPELRSLSGREDAVIAFLQQQPLTQQLLNDLIAFIKKWVPAFLRDQRSALTIAIGCTGGQHRSVYVVEQLAKTLVHPEWGIRAIHRELGK